MIKPNSAVALIINIEDGWMDGEMGGWMDRWIDRWVDGWMGRWVDGWTGRSGETELNLHVRPTE